MNNLFVTFLSIEIIKLLKNKINYLYLLVIVVFMMSSIAGIEVIGGKETNNAGYSYLLFSLQTFSSIVLPFMLLLFASTAVSNERTSGTIRNSLLIDTSRVNFFSSKILICLLFQIILMILSLLIAYLIGSLFFDFKDIMEDGIMVMTQGQFWINFIFAYGLLIFALFAVTSFGMFISTMAPNNIAAMTIAICAYILLEATKLELYIEDLIFSTYIEYPLNTLSEKIEGFYTLWTPDLYLYLLVSIIWTLVFLGLTYLSIRRIEVK